MSGHRQRRSSFCVLSLSLGIAATACGEELDKAELENAEAGAADLRLGRVHVVVEPDAEALDEELQVTASFAFVRGLEEDFVRARVDMPLLARDILEPARCMVDEFRAGEIDRSEGAETRELVLVDAGDMRVHIGEDRIAIPVSLVPDLVPYMSGVEYVYYGESLSSTDTEGSVAVEVHADGSQTDELPPFSAQGMLPEPLELTQTDSDLLALEEDALVFRWSPGSTETITARFTPMSKGEPVGDDITCVFPDRRGVRVDLDYLRTLGLPETAEALRVQASRVFVSTFDAGDFAGSELVVERRNSLTLPLR